MSDSDSNPDMHLWHEALPKFVLPSRVNESIHPCYALRTDSFNLRVSLLDLEGGLQRGYCLAMRHTVFDPSSVTISAPS